MATAFLNSSNDVIGISTSGTSLASAQSANPAIVAEILSAPLGLGVLNHPQHPTYHRHMSGDGTSLSHYAALEQLGAQKDARYLEIDTRTRELIGAGFAFAGKQFSLSVYGQLKLVGIHTVHTDPAVTYPIDWNVLDDSEVYPIANAATFHDFFLTAMGTYRAHVDSGTALKASCRVATTAVELAAVVDAR